MNHYVERAVPMTWAAEVTGLVLRSCRTLEALWLTGVDWPKARAQIGAAIRSERFSDLYVAKRWLNSLVLFSTSFLGRNILGVFGETLWSCTIFPKKMYRFSCCDGTGWTFVFFKA